MESVLAVIGTSVADGPSLLRGLTPSTSVGEALRRENDVLSAAPNVSISETEAVEFAVAAQADPEEATRNDPARQDALPRPADSNRGQRLDIAV
jgi:hypothetical protein